MAETTFCVWRRHADAAWQWGPVVYPAGPADPDGSASLLRWFDGRPDTYRDWAQGYYERPASAAAVAAMYAHRPLDEHLIAELNGQLKLPDLDKDVAEIGYPER